MKNGWTGGQYSLFRVLFGAYLFVHFAQLVPWGAELFSNEGVLPDGAVSPFLHVFPNLFALFDSPGVVTAALVLGAVAALFLAAGVRDRTAALVLWYLWACLFGRNPLISNPGLPYVGLLLVVHALLPPAPHGSWAARKRTDPRGGWSMDPRLFGVVWILMAVGYSYSGYTKLVSPSWVDGTAMARVLDNPLARPNLLHDLVLALPEPVMRAATWSALAAELLFLPLALFKKTRPWIWGGMLAMHCGLIALIDFTDLSVGMVMLHLFTFDPAWVRPRRASTQETVFYDGSCGLCHGFVRFALAEDTSAAFRFAPLQGPTFEESVPERERASVPDSIVVWTEEERLLVRSAAVVHVLAGMGGAWRVLGTLLAWIPRPLRDTGYDVVARIRHRLFAKPDGACPLVPPDLGARFRP